MESTVVQAGTNTVVLAEPSSGCPTERPAAGTSWRAGLADARGRIRESPTPLRKTSRPEIGLALIDLDAGGT
jgi:hypothetical protein